MSDGEPGDDVVEKSGAVGGQVDPLVIFWEFGMSDKSKCCTCGFEWDTGKNGGHSCSDTLLKRINKTLELGVQYGGIDGAHHKDWVIDQMVRLLAGDRYDGVVADACAGEDGPNTYSWDCGIAP